MSAGGVFRLIANDGKADKLIMATELLTQRIKDVMCQRQKEGKDPTPTLVDIEKTHILFVNSHFKPFAAIGYEYLKVRANTGSAQLGGTVQFSIPQYGDFFSDMVVNVAIDAASASVGLVPAFPAPVTGVPVPSGPTSQVSEDAWVGGKRVVYTQEYVDASGTVLTPGVSRAQNFLRYCEYPGERLFKKVKFDVNGNPLDEYTSEAVIFYQKFCVPPQKQLGWKRLVGQEAPIDAVSDSLLISGASKFDAVVTDLLDNGGNAVAGAPTSASITARKMVSILDGPQTPKQTQPELGMWVPLLFWFNKDSRLAIPSAAIPYGQRFITFDLERQENLLFLAPGNLFLRTTVEEQYSAVGPVPPDVTAVDVTEVKRWVLTSPVLAPSSTLPVNQTIRTFELYVNNIFVNPEIHDIYIKRIGFSLIRVNRQQISNTTKTTDNIHLNNLKWPIETMYVGLRPTENISSANPNQHRDWHKMTRVRDQVAQIAAGSSGKVAYDAVTPLDGATTRNFSAVQVGDRLVFPESVETINSLQLEAHGISIFHEYSAQFFRDYMSYTYGGPNIVTPEDKGAMMLNFCLHPGTYQPSGHLNVSRARELYLKYVSSQVGPAYTADLIVQAVAINFLLISDGSAVLRYST